MVIRRPAVVTMMNFSMYFAKVRLEVEPNGSDEEYPRHKTDKGRIAHHPFDAQTLFPHTAQECGKPGNKASSQIKEANC